MRVLVDGVMAAVERGGADIQALLVRDFFGADQARRVAGARGGDRGVEGMRRGVAERDAGRSGFDELAGERIFKHAGLRGHDAENLTHEGAEDTEERATEVLENFTVIGAQLAAPLRRTFLLLRGGGFCCGVCVFLREALDAAGGVDQFLLASEKGMAA